MLDSKKRKTLRALAHGRSALFQVGKDGISDNLIKTIKDSLEVHELLKISLLKTCPVNVREVAYDIASGTGSEVVYTIGRTFVIYKKSKKNKLEL